MNVRVRNRVCWIVSIMLILNLFMSSTVVLAASTISADDMEANYDMEPETELEVEPAVEPEAEPAVEPEAESEADLSMESKTESDFESLPDQTLVVTELEKKDFDLEGVDLEIEESSAVDDASVYSSTPAPVTGLYVTRVESENNDSSNPMSTTEDISRSDLRWTSKSMWFDDPVAENIICTYDNKGAKTHYRDSVDIYVMQEGQGTRGCYTRVDGGNETSAGSKIEVISAIPFRARHKYTIKKPNVEAPYTIFTVGHIETYLVGKTSKSERLETNVYIYWDYEGRADAPAVDFVYDQGSGQMVLSGADSSMEYRLKSGTTSSWLPCTDEPMYFDCALSATTYLVRYAANGDGNPSQSQEVILPALRYAPGATYSTTTEMLTNLKDGIEMRVGDGAYADLQGDSVSLSSIIDEIPSGSTMIVGIRYKGTSTQQAGREMTIKLYPRSEQPTTVVFDPIAIKLTGCSTAMQYKVDSGTWKAIPGATLSLQNFAETARAVPVYVRMKPTNTMAASKPVEFTIPPLANGPVGRVDYTNETIVGLENGNYQYSTTGSSWTALTISNGQWNISKLIGTSAKTLHLRWAATSTTPISGATLFNIPARPATPSSLTFDYSVHGQATLKGVTTAMQYKKSTETTWTDVQSNDGVVFEIPAVSTSYNVRVKATAQSFASANRTITLYKAGSAPSCTYDLNNEQIKYLSTKMEMQIGGGAFSPVTETSFSTTDLINTIPQGGSIVIQVRNMATVTSPTSAHKVFTLYARSAAPSGLAYNYETNTLTGCNALMQYKLDTDSSWRYIYNSTLSLKSFVSTERDVKVYVRNKATTTSSASNSVEFTIPRTSAS